MIEDTNGVNYPGGPPPAALPTFDCLTMELGICMFYYLSLAASAFDCEFLPPPVLLAVDALFAAVAPAFGADLSIVNI